MEHKKAINTSRLCAIISESWSCVKRELPNGSRLAVGEFSVRVWR